MSKTRKLWVGTGIMLLIVGLSGIALASSRDRGRPVRVETVDHHDLVSIVTASGIIQPKRKVDISADISGRVIELAVEEGQRVSEGDLLLRIDPTSFQAAVRRAEAAVAQTRAQAAQARANLLQARSAATRAEQLSKGDALISSQELEQATTAAQVAEAQYEAARFAVTQAQASLSEAQEVLRKTTILAPMSGRVTRLNIEQGETAIVGTMNNPGSLLLTIADLSVMEASVRVDETDVPHIVYGDSAIVRIDAYPEQTFSGRVTNVSNSAIQPLSGSGAQAQNQSVDFEVVVTLDDPPASLRPDLSATAEIVTATRQGTIAVPIIAVTVRTPEGKKFTDSEASQGSSAPAEAEEVEGVFLVREGKAEFVPIRIGIAGERYFEVEQGLNLGDLVVAGPYSVIRDLEDGDAVQIQNPEATSQRAETEEENR